MAAITWADVIAVAPELSTVAVAAQTDILNYVNNTLNVAEWGGEESIKYRLGRIFLAAHIGTLALPSSSGGVAGPITSESAGGLSRSYGSSASNFFSSGRSSTRYGQEYLALLYTTPARLPVVP